MSHPGLGKKTAVFINIVIIFILTFAILIQTASINKPEVKKNIPIPKTDKLSLLNEKKCFWSSLIHCWCCY